MQLKMTMYEETMKVMMAVAWIRCDASLPISAAPVAVAAGPAAEKAGTARGDGPGEIQRQGAG